MLMGMGSGCTGLLHTRYLTRASTLQGMNFVTFSAAHLAGI
jgi:hypothetical protein